MSIFMAKSVYLNRVRTLKIFKFGGSALQTKTNREKVIDIIQREKKEKILVVVSAMGKMGFPYATDTLYNLINKDIVSNKEVARLISCGEIISSIVLTNEIKEKGIKAESLSPLELGIKTEGDYISASIKNVVVDYIKEAFLVNDVVIIPGFIGTNEKGEICTFKRGGSDLTAVILAKYLLLNEVFLFKDVEGIYPTFPKISSKTKVHKYLSYQEMLLLTKLGFKVINDSAANEAMENNIKINIVDFENNLIGTEIGENSEYKECIGFMCGNNYLSFAAFFPNEILEKIKNELKSSHIFIKDHAIKDNILTIYVASSQIPVIRKKVNELFFYKWLYKNVKKH